MAVRGCFFCGYTIRYHGEPEGTTPIEHIFCPLNYWREFEEENLPVGSLEIEYEGIFFYAWRCERCGSFSFFDDYLEPAGFYVPKDEFSSEPMNAPFEFGPFWDDILWFEITEVDTPASEVLTRYPQTRWLAKNEDEMRIYEDEARTRCVAQFRRFQIVTPVTVATMSLDAFKKMLSNWDDIEFRYRGVYYNFMREENGINIYRGHGYQQIVYHAATTNVDEIINVKLFDDGKSIVEAQAEVEL